MPNQNFIAGSWVPAASGATDDVLNPATSAVIAEVPASDGADVDAAVAAAKEAFAGWRTQTPRARSEALYAVAQAIEDDLDTIKRLEMENCGKPASMIEFEMDLTVDNWRVFAGGARNLAARAPGEALEAHTSSLRREPVGVVGSIAPWNYPI